MGDDREAPLKLTPVVLVHVVVGRDDHAVGELASSQRLLCLLAVYHRVELHVNLKHQQGRCETEAYSPTLQKTDYRSHSQEVAINNECANYKTYWCCFDSTDNSIKIVTRLLKCHVLQYSNLLIKFKQIFLRIYHFEPHFVHSHI